MAKSTKSRRAAKQDDFPLWKHPNGQWAKRVRTKVYYFGTEREPALNQWLDVKDELLAGRVPRKWKAGGYTVRKLLDDYMVSRASKRDAKEISSGTFNDCHRACNLMAEVFNLDRPVSSLEPEDFAELREHVAKKFSPTTLEVALARFRGIFNLALRNNKIDRVPPYGDFNVPKRVVRRHLAKRGDLSFDAEELLALLETAKGRRHAVNLRAWILLGINCAFTQQDIADLDSSHIRGDKISFARGKCGTPRECVLWPETKEALTAAFPFQTTGRLLTAVTNNFQDLQDAAGLVRRKGRSFRGLRYTFETVCQEQECPQVVTDYVMGHINESMGSRYNQRISHERIQNVVGAVHDWLFGSTGPQDAARPTLRVVG